MTHTHTKTHSQESRVILLIVAVAAMLALSIFSIERFAGTGEVAHGATMYETLPMPRTQRISPTATKRMTPAQRREAARLLRLQRRR